MIKLLYLLLIRFDNNNAESTTCTLNISGDCSISSRLLKLLLQDESMSVPAGGSQDAGDQADGAREDGGGQQGGRQQDRRQGGLQRRDQRGQRVNV